MVTTIYLESEPNSSISSAPYPLQSGMCLSRAREDTERVRPRSEADMFINSNVTVIKAEGTF